MVKVDATEQLESALQKVYEIDIAKPAFGIHSRLLLLRDNPVNVLFVQTAYEKYRQLRYHHKMNLIGSGVKQNSMLI